MAFYKHIFIACCKVTNSVLANLKWVFLTPGNFFNTSEVRDLIAINPLIIFLCGQVLYEAKIKERSIVRLSRFLTTIVCLNLVTLSVVFLYPRLTFLYEYRNSSAKEVLLSPGPRDNPNMENLREVYRLMYFIKDHTEEDSEIYFISPYFSKAQACKILLPRGIYFVDKWKAKSLLAVGQQEDGKISYLVFEGENIPELTEKGGITWDENSWGIYKM